jgi:hypothetical protein
MGEMGDGLVEREYPYRGRAPVVVLVIAWGFALATLVWALIDVGPIRGRDGRVTVDEPTATAVRWTVVGLCVLFATFASRWVWIDLVRPRRIAFSPQGVYFPCVRWGWFSVEALMKYEGITDFRATVVKRIGFKEGVATRFHFRHVGRRFSISRDNLPEGAFEEVCAILAERVALANRE